MKKVALIILSLTVVCSVFAFSKGTNYLGGTASFSSAKASSDAETLTTITLQPELGVFILDNSSLDLIFKFISQSQGDVSTSIVGVGIGTKYYWKNFYAGIDFQHQSSSVRGSHWNGTSSGMFLNPKAGYLVSLIPHAYLDLGAGYLMGIGNYGGGSGRSNETRYLGFHIGLQYFFNE
ncbi:MAG: hypothetical protein LHW56_00680 [Candidatus Cloacimonetes bacterium]|jgi:hypothetical protein|nr:hypothetical protein [Candidatus Cloacimonadota bacterium]MDY0171400.1 hypothetical protein [Candidatus Cloacimonadaceae bacterium]